MDISDISSGPCNIVITGASGDLAKKKIIPALFSLYCNGVLPEEFRIYGFARSRMSDLEFRDLAMAHLTCRYVPGNDCWQKMNQFLKNCYYHAGNYGAQTDFESLKSRIEADGMAEANYLFYMAIPPSVFLDTAKALKGAGFFEETPTSWRRAVLEKPFGHDLASCCELLADMDSILTEEQTYRIDHYLGKEVIQNLLILRFSNLIFEPLWNHKYIEQVDIHWSESIGTPGRAGYFDQYGIIRDVIQNHLMQILALVGMEPPSRLDPRHICDEKVKLLECIEPLSYEDVTVGQYTGDGRTAGYLEEEGVPADSITPTYAKAKICINNARWHGVPFYLVAGKAMDETVSEIRIRFKDVPYSPFRGMEGMEANVLTVRIQPDESMNLQVVSKFPGLDLKLQPTSLKLHYQSAFNKTIHDAYERLLLDVLRGDKNLFPRADEVKVAWEVLTPVLHELEARNERPLPYAFGSSGPEETV